jgi:hypothetical protein
MEGKFLKEAGGNTVSIIFSLVSCYYPFNTPLPACSRQ